MRGAKPIADRSRSASSTCWSPPAAGLTVTLTPEPVSSTRLDLGAEQDRDAELLVVLEQLLGHVGVLGRHHAVEELDDRDVDAEVLHDVGELDADGAGAGDDDRAGQLGVEDLLLVGDDVLATSTPGSIRVDGAGAR